MFQRAQQTSPVAFLISFSWASTVKLPQCQAFSINRQSRRVRAHCLPSPLWAGDATRPVPAATGPSVPEFLLGARMLGAGMLGLRWGLASEGIRAQVGLGGPLGFRAALGLAPLSRPSGAELGLGGDAETET